MDICVAHLQKSKPLSVDNIRSAIAIFKLLRLKIKLSKVYATNILISSECVQKPITKLSISVSSIPPERFYKIFISKFLCIYYLGLLEKLTPLVILTRALDPCSARKMYVVNSLQTQTSVFLITFLNF